MKIFSPLIVFAFALALCGCVQQSDSSNDPVAGPEDYKYMGKTDPLMSVSAADRATVLSERFKLIQARQ